MSCYLISHRSIEAELMRIEAAEKAGRVSYVTLEEFERGTDDILRVAEEDNSLIVFIIVPRAAEY